MSRCNKVSDSAGERRTRAAGAQPALSLRSAVDNWRAEVADEAATELLASNWQLAGERLSE